ncbi:chemotaxis protein [Pseudomonas sp. CVAP|uniref:methyl-accepting chemotaxis protein n=1 Tax=Pseudomonas sp. CVAP\|nr:methyl-accepting chemotaxis protein [Pseudomonas sp. CVAP\
MKIKNKLVLAFVLVAFIPVSLVAVISVLNIRAQAVDQFLDGSTREIRQIDGNMRQFFDGTQQNVDQIATDPVYTSIASLKNYLAADAASQPLPPAAQHVIDAFARYGAMHPAAAILSIGLEDGSYAKWPDDPQLSNYDPRLRPWYKAAMASPGKTVRTPAYYYDKDAVALVGSARALLDDAGKAKGVLVVSVSLKNLTELVKSIKLGESGYVMLIEDGTVLVDPRDAGHSFKQLKDLGEPYAKLAATTQGSTEVQINGVRYMANIWTSPGLGWRYIGLIEYGEVMGAATRMTESSQAMVELEEGSRSINQILGTIRAIAEQTNLLALNAAIEAARAGDQGRGFAVVADEVRALAKRTSDSTGEIDQLLNTLGSKTQEVSQKMESCLDLSRASVSSIESARDSFEGIQLSVNEIRDQNLQISAAAEEQHSVAEEINRHIQQIYDEARLVESLANSAQEDSGRLSHLSNELNGLVGRFKS